MSPAGANLAAGDRPPHVTIVLCAHNVEAYLRTSLDSVVNQTYPHLEIICVDDASTDGTPGILQEYARRDVRIRILHFPENRSLSQARKDGALAATGQYILFLDADDYLAENACAVLVQQMQADPVDILHFDSQVINAGHLPEQRVAALQAYIRPYAGRLAGGAVLEGCYRHRWFHATMWNKLFSTELCRRAFRHIEDGWFPKAQDIYAFFVLAYFARSYRGVPDVRVHYYRFGSGITGQLRITADHFSRFCEQARIAPAIRRFLEQEQKFEDWRMEWEDLRARLREDCVATWQNSLVPADQSRGFDILVERWDAAEVIGSLARRNWGHSGQVARALRDAKSLQVPARRFATLGVYYHRLSPGGVQRVLSLLIPLWQRMGYNVVLLTEEAASPDDYALPEGVRRVPIPRVVSAESAEVSARVQILRQVLTECRIDVMLYHGWASRLLLWDLLAVKLQGIPFIIHTHSIFSVLLKVMGRDAAEIYALCDGTVSPGRIDQHFWRYYAPRAFYLPNPLTFDPAQTPAAPLAAPTVVWVGRFSKEKRPLEAIRIIVKVVEQVPDARLVMVGGGEEHEEALVAEEIRRLGMEKHVIRAGFQSDVNPFYHTAAVYLATSQVEGFLMGLAESKCHGVPGVIYDLPYLDMVRDGAGLVITPQEDVAAAANAIAELLQDRERRIRLGAAARASIAKYAAYDLGDGWRRVLEAVAAKDSAPGPDEALDETDQILMRELVGALEECFQAQANIQQDHNRAMRKVTRLEDRLAKAKEILQQVRDDLKAEKQELDVARRKMRKAVQAQAALRASLTFRVGFMVMRVPKWLYGKMRGVKQILAQPRRSGGSDENR